MKRLLVLVCLLAVAAPATASTPTEKTKIRTILRSDYTAGVTKNGTLFCAVRTAAARKRIVTAYRNLGKKGTCPVAATYVLRHNATIGPKRLKQIRDSITTAKITVHPATASMVSKVGFATFKKLNGRWYIDFISYVA